MREKFVCGLIVPDFAGEGTPMKDWNDLACMHMHGSEYVRQRIEEVVFPKKVEMPRKGFRNLQKKN